VLRARSAERSANLIAVVPRSRYTVGMKTAVSLPDGVFKDADRLARKLGKSRSQLYGDALAEYLARHGADSVTEAMDRVVAQVGAPQDELGRAAARRVLGRSEW
jgi:hypothetical protein